MIIEIDLSADLLRQWSDILRAYRQRPHGESVATPEMLALEMREENRLCAQTARQLLAALMRHQPAALDCDLLDAVERAKEAHDRARKEGR